jgi:pimeloyl-ACP methyl ester carboxylesterase
MRTWIFLRGLSRSSLHWGEFVAQFQRELPQDAVLTLDLPGNGTLHLVQSPVRVRDMVEHCRLQLSAQGVAPPYNLLAMSLGGMVAADWAARYPQEVAGAVLINTSMRPFSRFFERLRVHNYPLFLKLATAGASDVQWERSILKITSRKGLESVIPQWLALRRRYPVSKRNVLRQLWAAARFRAPTTKPAAPILVLGSEGDYLVSVKCSMALAAQWKCSLHLHPTAGHDLPLDDGPWVAQKVGQWIGRQVPD